MICMLCENGKQFNIHSNIALAIAVFGVLLSLLISFC